MGNSATLRAPVLVRLKAVAAACVFTVGCASTPDPASIARFASLSDKVGGDVAHAYQRINDLHQQASVMSFVADPHALLRPGRFPAWITPESIRLRIHLLNAIVEYAAALEVLANGQPVQSFRDASTGLGASLSRVDDRRLASSFRVDDEKLGMLTTAVNALGSWLVAIHAADTVHDQIQSVHPGLTTITETMRAEIGTLNIDDNGGVGAGSKGLRADAWQHFDTQLIALARIHASVPADDARQRKHWVERFVEIEQRRRAVDRTLAATAGALRALNSAHAALLEATRNPDYELYPQLRRLVREADRLHRLQTSFVE